MSGLPKLLPEEIKVTPKPNWTRRVGYILTTLFVIAIIAAFIAYSSTKETEHKPVLEVYEEETHLYINEKGAYVDEKIIRDTKNELLVLHVPAHHDIVESRVILDEKNKLMMTVLPDAKTCQVTKKAPLPTTEEAVFKTAKHDKSTLNQPIDLKDKEIKVIEVQVTTTTGPEIPHDALPEKFRPHCPSNYAAYMSKLTLKGENSKYPQHLDDYDYVPETVILAHPRNRRAARRNTQSVSLRACLDHHNQKSRACRSTLAVYCPESDGCPPDQTLQKCTIGGSSCFYYMVPCHALEYNNGTKMSLEETTQCLFHLRNTPQSCTTCCRNQNCGSLMPKCSGLADSHCEWANWSGWSDCDQQCSQGNRNMKRGTRRKNPNEAWECKGEENIPEVCDGTMTLAERREIYHGLPASSRERLYSLTCPNDPLIAQVRQQP
jgi:hypothetical protein